MAGNPALRSDVLRDLGEAENGCSAAAARARSLEERGAAMDEDTRLDRQLAVGTMLHGSYCSLGRALERLVRKYDGDLPQGREYHMELIDRAAHEIEGIRPAMISQATARDLHVLRAFRHVVRNNYGGFFDYARTAPNVEIAVRTTKAVREELAAFAKGTGLVGERGPGR